MISNNAFVDGLLYEHRKFPKRALLEGFFSIELDILDTAIPPPSDLGIVFEVLIY